MVSISDVQKLYNKNDSFRFYVDMMCDKLKVSQEDAFNDVVVKSYAERLLKNEKTVRRN